MCGDGKPCTRRADCASGNCGVASANSVTYSINNHACGAGTCNWDPAKQEGRCSNTPTKTCFPDVGAIVARGTAEVREGFYIAQLANLLCMPSFDGGLVDMIGGFPGMVYFEGALPRDPEDGAAMRSALLLVSIAMFGCRPDTPATEVVVTVDSTFGVPCTIDALRVELDTCGTDRRPARRGLAAGLGHPRPRQRPFVVGGDGDGHAWRDAVRERERRRDLRGRDLARAAVVLDRTCVPGPCPAIGVGGYHGLPPQETRRTCAGDAYASVPTLFVVRDICNSTSAMHVLPNTDEAELALPVPLPFPFRISARRSNRSGSARTGYLGFGAVAPNKGPATGVARPLGTDNTFGVRGLLAFWDDLRTGTQGICVGTSGESPDRILWFTWKEACFSVNNMPCASTERLTFTAAIEETTDRIYVGYHEMVATGANADRAKGLTAVVGITDDAPRGCPSAACMPDGTCAGTGVACHYTEVNTLRITTPLPSVELVPR